MNYCEESELRKYVLKGYLDAVEQQFPGSVLLHITSVSEEIKEAVLQGGYELQDYSSATLKRICAVLAAWRCVGQITSLMSSESSSDNEWVPLQKLYNSAVKDLELIRSGKLNPYPSADTGSGVSVSAPSAIFTNKLWEKF
jgi:hypothetical protein